jgi:surfactin synthase thioesterase subunit
VFRVSTLVDIAHFARTYLQDLPAGDRPGEAGGMLLGTRTRVRRRVQEAIDGLVLAGQYHRITVVGFSFGGMIAVDVLADAKPSGGPPLRLVTLGPPLATVAGELRRHLRRTRASGAH